MAQKLESLLQFNLKSRRVLKGHQGKVLCMDWSTDKRHVVSSSQVGHWSPWDGGGVQPVLSMYSEGAGLEGHNDLGTFSSLLILSCDQAAPWMVQSDRPSVCLSVRHTLFTMFPSLYHHEIFRSYYQWQKWCPMKRSRSKVKVTEVKTQFSRFQTATPVEFAYHDEMMHKAWCCLEELPYCFYKVNHQISRSHRTKNRQFWPELRVSGLQLKFEFSDSFEMLDKA